MSKILFWGLKIISVIFLIIPIMLCLPGVIFHVLSEEWGEYISENNDEKIVK
jgi:hypothetical protein